MIKVELSEKERSFELSTAGHADPSDSSQTEDANEHLRVCAAVSTLALTLREFSVKSTWAGDGTGACFCVLDRTPENVVRWGFFVRGIELLRSGYGDYLQVVTARDGTAREEDLPAQHG